MSLTLQGAFETVEVLWWWEPPSRGRVLAPRGPGAARLVLARARGAAADVRALRRFVAEHLPGRSAQLDDAAVVDQISAWLVNGRLRVAADPRTLAAISRAKAEEQPAEIPWDARPAAVEEIVPAAVESTFPEDVDAPAIAALMKEAARLGVPFCEQCTRKRLARERAEEGSSSERAA